MHVSSFWGCFINWGLITLQPVLVFSLSLGLFRLTTLWIGSNYPQAYLNWYWLSSDPFQISSLFFSFFCSFLFSFPINLSTLGSRSLLVAVFWIKTTLLALCHQSHRVMLNSLLTNFRLTKSPTGKCSYAVQSYHTSSPSTHWHHLNLTTEFCHHAIDHIKKVNAGIIVILFESTRARADTHLCWDRSENPWQSKSGQTVSVTVKWVTIYLGIHVLGRAGTVQPVFGAVSCISVHKVNPSCNDYLEIKCISRQHTQRSRFIVLFRQSYLVFLWLVPLIACLFYQPWPGDKEEKMWPRIQIVAH